MRLINFRRIDLHLHFRFRCKQCAVKFGIQFYWNYDCFRANYRISFGTVSIAKLVINIDIVYSNYRILLNLSELQLNLHGVTTVDTSRFLAPWRSRCRVYSSMSRTLCRMYVIDIQQYLTTMCRFMCK